MPSMLGVSLLCIDHVECQLKTVRFENGMTAILFHCSVKTTPPGNILWLLNCIYSEQGFPPPENDTQTMHLSGGNGSVWVISPIGFAGKLIVVILL